MFVFLLLFQNCTRFFVFVIKNMYEVLYVSRGAQFSAYDCRNFLGYEVSTFSWFLRPNLGKYFGHAEAGSEPKNYTVKEELEPMSGAHI